MTNLIRNVSGPILIGVLLSIATGFVCLYDLDQFPVFQWDEARYVNNSVEIAQNGHWLDYRMDGEIDHWNFKPPLVLWLQALSMKIFGYTELGARLPSALACIGIALLLYWFCVTRLKSLLAGVVAVLFFLASPGFFGPHMGRSADLDAVQTFFVLAYTLYFIRYLLGDYPPARSFAVLAGLVFGAFLCKGMPGLLLLPYLAIIGLLPGNHRKLLPHKSLYLFAGLTLLACAAYYGLREWQSAGYWALVKKSEFNRFSGEGLGWHKHPWDFYLNNFTELKRYPLIWFVPLTISAFFVASSPLIRRVYGYFLGIAVGYLAFISWPPVKLEWYDAPLYPLFALLWGIAVAAVAERVELWQKRRLAWGLALVLTLPLCMSSYRLVWEKIQYHPDKMADFEREGVFIRQIENTLPDFRLDFAVVKTIKHPEHLDQVKFYQKTWKTRFGVDIGIVTDPQTLSAGQIVLIAQPATLEAVRARFPAASVLFESPYGQLLDLH